MPQRARTNTMQDFENRFADLPLDQQEKLLDTLQIIHRFSARQDRKETKKKSPAAVTVGQIASPLANAALAEQPSLTGLPDEDQRTQ